MRRLVEYGALALAISLGGCGPTASDAAGNAAEAANAAVEAAPDLAGARRFVDAIYAPYVAGEPGSAADHFAPELAAALERAGEPGLEADPFCDCQDFQQFGYKVQSVEPSATGAVARVAISNMGAARTVVVHLVRSGGAWKVGDVGEGEASLLRRLSGRAG